MKAERNFPYAIVTKKAEKMLTAGHVWVYDAEITDMGGWPEEPAGGLEGGSLPENGALVDVKGPSGKYLGTGFLSLASKIRIRIVSKNANDTFDEAFWERRLRYAWQYRKDVMGEEIGYCRLIFGEADQFPGLTVDRYGDVLVTQVLSYGIEQIKDLLYTKLAEILEKDGAHVAGIYERNDLAARRLEGLEEGKGWYPLPGRKTPDSTILTIEENGLKYQIDIENGQKTGYFLDQRYNRRAVADIARGKRVLDCFTHTGAFALNAARGGAAHVTAVDVSGDALKLARQNAELNGLTDRMDFLQADVMDLLPKLLAEGRRDYDFIILDPPAFTKSRKTVDNAMRGYKEINFRAMKLLPRGGYLATCSCSHFAEEWRFREMLRDAAREAGVSLKQIEARQQSKDHPILWGVEETNYLKFFLFQVI